MPFLPVLALMTLMVHVKSAGMTGIPVVESLDRIRLETPIFTLLTLTIYLEDGTVGLLLPLEEWAAAAAGWLPAVGAAIGEWQIDVVLLCLGSHLLGCILL